MFKRFFTAFVGLSFASIAVCSPVHAKPVATVNTGKAIVVLTDEPCAVPAVTNLPNRATWTEGGVVYEGCWAVPDWAPIVVAYWTDKTIALLPVHAFSKAEPL